MKMKRAFKILAVSLVAVMLMGAKCKKDDPASAHISIDPSLKQRCPELPIIDLDTVPMGALLVAYKDLQVQYIECAIRNDCLIETVDSKIEIKCPALGRLDEQRKEIEETR